MNVAGGEGLSSSRRSLDFDLNLAPIIDCLTVLIAFMLISASFLSIGILDAGISANTEQTKSNTPPPSVNLTVTLNQNFDIQIQITDSKTGANKLAKTLAPIKPGAWDLARLDSELKTAKTKWHDLTSLTLMANDNVQYQDIVKIMDGTRKIIPVILLGGF